MRPTAGPVHSEPADADCVRSLSRLASCRFLSAVALGSAVTSPVRQHESNPGSRDRITDPPLFLKPMAKLYREPYTCTRAPGERAERRQRSPANTGSFWHQPAPACPRQPHERWRPTIWATWQPLDPKRTGQVDSHPYERCCNCFVRGWRHGPNDHIHERSSISPSAVGTAIAVAVSIISSALLHFSARAVLRRLK